MAVMMHFFNETASLAYTRCSYLLNFQIQFSYHLSISAESAIEWAVKQDSDLGSEVSDRLNHGQAIPEALTLKIVSQRIAALDIKHHGIQAITSQLQFYFV